jgi:hypothetical protein
MSRVTTLPAPIVELSPMVTPGQTMAAPDPHVVTDRDGFRRFGPPDALLSVERMGRALVAPARPGDLNC